VQAARRLALGLPLLAASPSSERALSDARPSEQVKVIHAESRGTYGARRVHAALRHRGIRVGRKRVERLMRGLGLSGLLPRKRGRTTIRVPGVRVAADLVERDFRPSRPDELWVADIKYVPTWQGWLFLAAVVDCYSRRVVGWSMRAGAFQCDAQAPTTVARVVTITTSVIAVAIARLILSPLGL